MLQGAELRLRREQTRTQASAVVLASPADVAEVDGREDERPPDLPLLAQEQG